MNILNLDINKIGFFFDFNGTLFWDSDKHELAWRIFIKKLCNRDISDMEFLQYVHGRNNDFILEYFLEKSLSADIIHDLSEKKETIYRKLCIEDKVNLQLAPGAILLLDHLKKYNIPRIIAMASTKVNVDFYRKEFQLNNWFDNDKIIYNDGTIKGKPNPDIYIKAAA
ncbi:MAG: HAD family hydrolase [Velocimicrobium sp.]